MDRIDETAGAICGLACRHFGEASVSHTFREKVAEVLRALLERVREDERVGGVSQAAGRS